MKEITITLMDHTYSVPIRNDADEFFGVDIDATPFLYRITGSCSEKQLREHFEELIRKIKENKK